MTESASTVGPAAPTIRWKERFQLAIKLLIAGGLLTWLLLSHRLDLTSLGEIRSAGYLLLAAGCLLIHMALPVWRWQWLLAVQQLQVGWAAALRMTWLGYFAAIFLPGLAGGDLAKAYVACRARPGAKTRAVSTVLMDRILGLHSLLAIGAVAGGVILLAGCEPGQGAIAWFVIACLLLLSAGGVLLLWRPTSDLAMRLVPRRAKEVLEESLQLYRVSMSRLVLIWLFAVVGNLPGIAGYLLVAVALGIRPAVVQGLAAPLVIVANSLPISPGGLGVGEAVGSELFSEFGISAGALIVLLVRLNVIILSIPGVAGILIGQTRSGVGAKR